MRLYGLRERFSHYYFHTGSHSSAEKLDVFMVSISMALRQAHLLRFHRLGEDATIMPGDDVSVPLGASPLKRELAQRLWYYLVFLDSIIASSSATMPMVALQTCEPD